MTHYEATVRQTIPGRGMQGNASIAAKIAAAKRSVEALEAAGLNATYAKQQLARLEATNA